MKVETYLEFSKFSANYSEFLSALMISFFVISPASSTLPANKPSIQMILNFSYYQLHKMVEMNSNYTKVITNI